MQDTYHHFFLTIKLSASLSELSAPVENVQHQQKRKTLHNTISFLVDVFGFGVHITSVKAVCGIQNSDSLTRIKRFHKISF